MATITITAESLTAGYDDKGLFLIVKVRDDNKRHHVLFIPAVTVHWYLRKSKELPDVPLSEIAPQPEMSPQDLDGTFGHVLTGRESWNEYRDGLKIEGETQRGHVVHLTLCGSCHNIFRKYAVVCAPYLVDLDGRSPGGSA